MKNLFLTLIILGVLTKVTFAGPRLMWDKVSTDEKTVCLTFDDGPNKGVTEKVLDVLKKYNVKATFFVIGQEVKRYPELVKRIAAEGNEVGNHSYTIGHLLFLQSAKNMKKQILKTNELIAKNTGAKVKYFRPPNGLMTNTMKEVVEELGLKPVGVNVFIFDNLISNPKTISKRILKRIKGGPLILVLHDGYRSKSRKIIADVLETIIPEIKNQGYRFSLLDKCVCGQ